MKNIVFEKTDDGNQFTFKDEDGTDFCFQYYPSIQGLWDDINLKDFDVQLLVHPFLNKESNVFALESNLKTMSETVGYLFPVSVLDSNSFEAKRQSDNNYLFVAYNVLLERLKSIDEGIFSLGNCFEENICVCVLNLRTIGHNKGVWNCIHSLRMYGYSYFVDNNRYKEIDGYSFKDYKDLLPGSKIHVKFSIPSMYNDPIIDGIIRSLPNADNLVYRFMLLYQIIEFLIAKIIRKSINDAIAVYKNSSCSENDFLEAINLVRKERGIINDILSHCDITPSLSCNKDFNLSCTRLFDIAGIALQKQDKDNSFYSFRNQMVHSYRVLSNYKEELANTLFHYERVVLTIVEKFPYMELG